MTSLRRHVQSSGPYNPGYDRLVAMTFVALAVVGLCMGSFVNALVWRVYEQARLHREAAKPKLAKAKRRQLEKEARELSIIKGRSRCTHCGHELAARDLIPVLSWLELRGKCRYCGAHIDDTPLVELATSALFVLSYWRWPRPLDAQGTTNLIVWLVILTGLVALFVYDIRWLRLPNRIVYPLIIIALALVLANALIFGDGAAAIRDAVLSVAICGGFFYLIYQISGGKWIGGGDVKLGILIGLVLPGWEQGFVALFLASVLGTLTILPFLFAKKITATSKVPFGPFLIAATIIVKLFGAGFIAWYKLHVLGV
jgi:prepilin signal peptidase PulO-like enzyme (type II secretory pathway)